MADTKSKSKFENIVLSAIIAAVIIYLIVIVAGGSFSKYSFEEAQNMTVSESINATGWIIRDEAFITNTSGGGAVSYTLADGETANAGSVIANVYQSEAQVTAHKELEQIEEQLDALKQISSASSASADLNTLNLSLNTKLTNLAQKINERDFVNMKSDKSSVVSSINQRRIFTGKVQSYDDKIAELESRVAELSNQTYKQDVITSQLPGYFVSRCDGYEKVFDFENLSELDADTLAFATPQKLSDDCVGKIIKSFDWYIAALVEPDDALRITQSDTQITVSIPFASSSDISVSFVGVNQKNKKENGVAIFKCTSMNSSLAQIRTEPIAININTYSGVRVSKKAIHDNKIGENGQTVQGVYVLDGERVQFKQIEIIYSGSDFVICNPNPEDGKILTEETIRQFDKVILEGSDLYEGKVID